MVLNKYLGGGLMCFVLPLRRIFKFSAYLNVKPNSNWVA